MNAGRKTLITGVLIFLLFIASANTCYGETLTEDEYEVISALVESYYGSDIDLILIAEMTEPWCIVVHLGEIKKKWKELSDETFDSIIRRNASAVVLERKLKIDADYRLISMEEYFSILGDSLSQDWDNFDRIYPDTPGVLVLSRAGFNSDRSQALVYFCNAYRCSDERILPKTRNIAFFLKKDGKWRLKETVKGFRTFSGFETGRP
ncbi:MAG: hypothetical protein JW814_03825 [Candidatus Krumholzibacteriota bacterium]|nr:hypothetical protein [Candidatus Krumholzibacteriota bacterium]